MSIFWIQFVFLVVLTKETKAIKANLKRLARKKEYTEIKKAINDLLKAVDDLKKEI